MIQEASRSHNVPPSLIKAVIRVESNFNPSATSPKGAQGLMQLMPGTADDLMVANPYDPRENISGGVRYLRMLLEKFNNRLPLALAAYNAGPKRVSQRLEVPAIPETQGFVQDVCTEFLKYSGEPLLPHRSDLLPSCAAIHLESSRESIERNPGVLGGRISIGLSDYPKV